MAKIRIATVTATGQRYLVESRYFAKSKRPDDVDKVYCWGELTSFKGLASKHEAKRTFLATAVTVAEVDHTVELLRELFDQRLKGLKEKGVEMTRRVTRTGNIRVTIHGTPEQQAARAEANARLFEDLAPLAEALRGVSRRASARGGLGRPYREPEVVQGPDAPIPEERPDVLEKILNRLTTEGAHLQQYSNGEFTTSSLAVGLTFDDCKGVQVLETPGYTVHYDKALGLFWRQGGCWD